MRQKRSLVVVCGVVLLMGGTCLASGAWAQDVRVQASVNATTIGTEERVVYSLEIEGGDMSDVRVPEPPDAENLILEQSMPSTSRNVSILNGRMRQSVTYRWSYRPRAAGEATIAATAVQVGDRRFTTSPIRLRVVPQSQRPQSPPSAQNNSGWPFNRRQPSQPQANRQISDGDLFIRAIPTKRQAYPNEQVVIEYRLYGREHIQLRQSRLTDSWDAEGFWREELEVDTRPVPTTVIENGLRYNMIVLKRVAVFPTRTGNLTVDPLRIESEVYIPGRSSDPFSAFFPNTSFQPIQLASPPVNIEVRPLPAGAPDGFAGAVGQFQLAASMDQDAVEVGQSVQVELQITGTGNLATLAPPSFDAPGIFEQYDPQINTNVNRSGRAIRGTKTVNHVLVPRSNGTVEMPEVALVYFDPDVEAYQRASAQPGTLRITGSAGPIAGAATRAGLPVDDIAGIKTGEVEWHRLASRPLHTSPFPYLGLLLPVLAVGGAVVYKRRERRLASDLRYARSRRAHPLAKKHLREAEELLSNNDSRRFYAEVERALLAFLGNRLDIPETGLTRQQLDAHLRDRRVPADVREELYRLLDESEQAQFAPVPPDHTAMETAIERASRAIVAVDEAARAARVGAPA